MNHSAIDFLIKLENEVEAQAEEKVPKRTGDWYKPKETKHLSWGAIAIDLIPKSQQDPETKSPRFDMNSFRNAIWRGLELYAKNVLKMTDKQAISQWRDGEGRLLILRGGDDGKKARSFVTIPGVKRKLSEFSDEELSLSSDFAKEIINKAKDDPNYLDENKEAFSKWMLLVLKDALKEKGLGSVESIASESIDKAILGISHNLAVNIIFSLVQYNVLKQNGLLSSGEDEKFVSGYIIPAAKKILSKASISLEVSTLNELINKCIDTAKTELKANGFGSEDIDEIGQDFKNAQSDADFFAAVGNNDKVKKSAEDTKESIYSMIKNNTQVLDSIRGKLINNDVVLKYTKALGYNPIKSIKKIMKAKVEEPENFDTNEEEQKSANESFKNFYSSFV
jgi:hypothetical protein